MDSAYQTKLLQKDVETVQSFLDSVIPHLSTCFSPPQLQGFLGCQRQLWASCGLNSHLSCRTVKEHHLLFSRTQRSPLVFRWSQRLDGKTEACFSMRATECSAQTVASWLPHYKFFHSLKATNGLDWRELRSSQVCIEPIFSCYSLCLLSESWYLPHSHESLNRLFPNFPVLHSRSWISSLCLDLLCNPKTRSNKTYSSASTSRSPLSTNCLYAFKALTTNRSTSI